MEKIGRHQYAGMKNRTDLTEEQKNQVEEFEIRTGIRREVTKADLEYVKKINELAKLEEQKETRIESNELYKKFIFLWQKQSGNWLKNDITINNLKPIIFWFCKDERFFDCANLTKISEPSFEKGLCVIGGYGTGKSETMRIIQMLFAYDKFRSYKFLNTNDVVHRFEACQEATDRATFYQHVQTGRTLFDDIKNEREASNYGKVSIFKEILINRANTKTLTHLTANYKKGYEGNMVAAVDEFGEKYDAVLYDRMFANYNFLQFNGKSFRK